MAKDRCKNASPAKLIDTLMRIVQTRQRLLGRPAYSAEREYNIRRLINERFVKKFMQDKLSGLEKEQEQMFKTAEAILEVKNGKPTFGTKIKATIDTSNIDFSNENQMRKYIERTSELESQGFKKETSEDGVEVYSKPRYTKEEGEQLWEGLSDKAKQTLVDYATDVDEADTIFNRNLQKEIFDIKGNIEGYITHFGFENGLIDTFRKVLFRKRKAAFRKQRTEAEGFTEDFGQAVSKQMLDALNEQDYNRMIEILENELLEPLDDINPLKEGYVEVNGSLKLGYPSETLFIKENEFGEVTMFKPGKPKQVRADILKEFTSMRDALQTAHHWLYSFAESMGTISVVNLLLQTGTLATNIFGGALQYGAKMIEDFWKGVFTGNPKLFLNDMLALLDSFRPSTIKSLPPELWGGATSNFYETIQPQTDVVSLFGSGLGGKVAQVITGVPRFISQAASGGFQFLWNPIENYYKRSIALSEFRSRGVEPRKRDVPGELFAEAEDKTKPITELMLTIDEIIDTYAFNYKNQPFWMSQWKRKWYAPWVKPFISYPYNLVMKHYQHYWSAFNPKEKLNFKDRLPRIMTVATIASILWYIYHKNDDEKIGPTVEGMDYETDKGGRLNIGKDKEGNELYLRTAKYPWLHLGSFFEGGKETIKGLLDWDILQARQGFSQISDITHDLIGSLGPGIELVLHSIGYRDKYEKFIPLDVLLAQDLSTIALPRELESLAKLQQDFKRKSNTPLETFLGHIPFVSEEKKGDIKTIKVPLKPEEGRGTFEYEIKKNQGIELLKELLGINIKPINPEIYDRFLVAKINRDISRLFDEEAEFESKSRALDELIYLNKFVQDDNLEALISSASKLRAQALEKNK